MILHDPIRWMAPSTMMGYMIISCPQSSWPEGEVITFIKDKQCYSGHLNEAMAQSICKDRMSGYDNPNIFEDRIPNALIRPAVDVVHASQYFGFGGGYLTLYDFVLLETQGHCWHKKPDQLEHISRDRSQPKEKFYLLWRTSF